MWAVEVKYSYIEKGRYLYQYLVSIAQYAVPVLVLLQIILKDYKMR